MTDQLTAVSILSDATIRAAVDVCHTRSFSPDIAALTESIRSTIKAALPRILEEWKAALDAHSTEAFLQSFMNAQAWELGIQSVDALCPNLKS